MISLVVAMLVAAHAQDTIPGVRPCFTVLKGVWQGLHQPHSIEKEIRSVLFSGPDGLLRAAQEQSFAPERFGVVSLSGVPFLVSPSSDSTSSFALAWREKHFLFVNRDGRKQFQITVRFNFQEERVEGVYLWPADISELGSDHLVFKSSAGGYFYSVSLTSAATGSLSAELMDADAVRRFRNFAKSRESRKFLVSFYWNDDIHILPSYSLTGDVWTRLFPDRKRVLTRVQLSTFHGSDEMDFYGTRFSGVLGYKSSRTGAPSFLLIQKYPQEGPSEHLLSRIHPSLRDDRWKFARTRLLDLRGLQIVSGYQPTGIVQWASVLKIEGIDVLMLYERADKNLGREDAFKGDKLVFLNLRDLSLIFTYQPSFSGGDKRNVSKLWEFIRDSYGLYRAFQAGILDSSK